MTSPWQASLFSRPAPPSVKETAPEQARELARVEGDIAPIVMRFLASRGVGAEFHAEDVRSFVAAQTGRAPGSADRILRLLRQRGHVSYSVVNRAASLYRIDGVKA